MGVATAAAIVADRTSFRHDAQIFNGDVLRVNARERLIRSRRRLREAQVSRAERACKEGRVARFRYISKYIEKF